MDMLLEGRGERIKTLSQEFEGSNLRIRYWRDEAIICWIRVVSFLLSHWNCSTTPLIFWFAVPRSLGLVSCLENLERICEEWDK